MGYLKVDDFEKKQHYITQKFCQADQDMPCNSSKLFYSVLRRRIKRISLNFISILICLIPLTLDLMVSHPFLYYIVTMDDY